jgi:hypothetical protein
METETSLPEKPPQICRRALKMNGHRRQAPAGDATVNQHSQSLSQRLCRKIVTECNQMSSNGEGQFPLQEDVLRFEDELQLFAGLAAIPVFTERGFSRCIMLAGVLVDAEIAGMVKSLSSEPETKHLSARSCLQAHCNIGKAIGDRHDGIHHPRRTRLDKRTASSPNSTGAQRLVTNG